MALMAAPNDGVFVCAGIDFGHTKSNEHSQEQDRTVFLLPPLAFNQKGFFKDHWMGTWTIHDRQMGTGTVFQPKNGIFLCP